MRTNQGLWGVSWQPSQALKMLHPTHGVPMQVSATSGNYNSQSTVHFKYLYPSQSAYSLKYNWPLNNTVWIAWAPFYMALFQWATVLFPVGSWKPPKAEGAVTPWLHWFTPFKEATWASTGLGICRGPGTNPPADTTWGMIKWCLSFIVLLSYIPLSDV